MPTTPTKTRDPWDAMTPLIGLMSWPVAGVAAPWQRLLEAWTDVWMRPVTPRVAEGPAIAESPQELPAFRIHPPGRTIAELSVGDSASISRRFTQADVEAFARMSGDDNPAHVDEEWAAGTRLGGRVVHGMLTASLISAVLGTELPGPGSIYMSQTLRWTAPVRPGDMLVATATVKEIIADKGRVVLETVVTCEGAPVMLGEALVMPPPAPESDAPPAKSATRRTGATPAASGSRASRRPRTDAAPADSAPSSAPASAMPEVVAETTSPEVAAEPAPTSRRRRA